MKNFLQSKSGDNLLKRPIRLDHGLRSKWMQWQPSAWECRQIIILILLQLTSFYLSIQRINFVNLKYCRAPLRTNLHVSENMKRLCINSSHIWKSWNASINKFRSIFRIHLIPDRKVSCQFFLGLRNPLFSRTVTPNIPWRPFVSAGSSWSPRSTEPSTRSRTKSWPETPRASPKSRSEVFTSLLRSTTTNI